MIQQTLTLGEFLTLIDGKPVNDNNAKRLNAWRNGSGCSTDWCGISEDAKPNETATQAARRLIREGWDRGVNLMTKVAADIEMPVPQNIRRRSRWADQGDDVEMQRIWSGNIESAWRKMHKASGLGPQRVRILVDSIAGGSVDAEVMRWRGVAALRLADALITAGYSVRVESGFQANAETDYRLRVVVKDYTSPLDLASLAATTACPAFFRALGHEYHFIAATEGDVSAGYYVEKIEADNFVDTDDDAPLFVAKQSIKNATDAGKWVTQCIEKLQPSEEEYLLAA